MCCRTVLYLDPNLPIETVVAEVERIALLAGFARISETRWVRTLPPSIDEHGATTERAVSMTIFPVPHNVVLGLTPTIGQHNLEDHRVNALGGSVLFKVAMTLGERLDARIVQASLIGGCRHDAGQPERVLAEYPSIPMQFEQLCWGFREVLLHGVGQEPPHHEDE